MSSSLDERNCSHGYKCKLQSCNIFLILFGLVFMGIASTQFTELGLDNYRQIDLRLLNYFHILVGCIGLYCVQKTRGILVLKTLYIVSCILAVCTIAFYILTTIKIVHSYRQLVELEEVLGFIQTNGLTTQNYPSRIAVTGILIAIALLTAVVAVVAAALLDQMLSTEITWTLKINSKTVESKFGVAKFTTIGIAKLVIAVCALGLAAFIDYEHQLISKREDYFRIVLDHMAAIFVIASAFTDFHALINDRHNTINRGVCIAISVISAVWCIKAADNNMFPFFKNDISLYHASETLTASVPITRTGATKLIVMISHAVLVNLFSILFIICAVSALGAATWLPKMLFYKDYSYVDQKVIVRGRFFNIMHIFWSIFLLLLIILGLSNTPWTGEYIGGDVFWVSILFFSTGILFSSNQRILILLKFVLNVASFSVALEKTLITINLIYQSATHSSYTNEDVTNQRTFIAQIILYSLQCFILVSEIITSGIGSVFYGKEIQRRSFFNRKLSVIFIFLSMGSLFYGITLCTCYVLFELGKWRFSQIPLETPFYPLGNGLFAIATFCVQIIACFSQQFILAAIILQTVLCSLSLFVINATVTNVYYIHSILRVREANLLTLSERTIYVVALTITSIAVLACILNALFGIIYILGLLFNDELDDMQDSTLHLNITPTSLSSPQLQQQEPQTSRTGILKNTSYSLPNPEIQQIAVQPVEEQTVYWSAEENPYTYKQTKTYYEQSKQNDSTYCGSHGSPSSYFQEDKEIETTKLEKPPRAGGNKVISKTKIAYASIERKK